MSGDKGERVIFTTTEQLRQMREGCQNLDNMRQVPDKAADFLGSANKFASPVLDILTGGQSIPFTKLIDVELKGYKFMRERGWHPLGDRPEVCEMLDGDKPGLPRLVNIDEYDFKQPLKFALPGAEPALPAKLPKHKPAVAKPAHPGQKASVEKDFRLSAAALQQVKDIAKANGMSLDELNTKIDTLIDLQAKSLQEQKELSNRIELQQNLQGMMMFASFLGQIGQVTQNKEVQTFAVIAQAGIQIAMAVTGLIAAAGVMACFGPIGMIGSAVMLIASLFMKPGPDPTELILKQIGKLSEQLSKVSDYMQSGFLRSEKMQMEILRTCVNGFNLLHEQIDRRMRGLDIKLHISLEDIKERLNFLIKYSDESAVENYCQDLNASCLQAHHLLIGVYPTALIAEAQKQSATLSQWAVEKSCNPLLTGRTIFKSQPKNDLLKECFQQRANYRDIHSFLGFIGEYVKQQFKASFASKQVDNKTIATLDLEKLANPDLWLKSVLNYIALNSEFSSADMDPRNIILDSMIAVGERGQDFTHHLRHDKTLWDEVFKHYKTCLKKVKLHANNYATQHNRDTLAKLNDTRKKNDKTNQADISTLDFIKAPSELIQQFDKRRINNLHGEIKTFDELGKITLLEQQKLTEPAICENIPAVAKECLAAQFLQLLTLAAEQSTYVNDYEMRSKNFSKWQLAFKLLSHLQGDSQAHEFATVTLEGNCEGINQDTRDTITKFVRDYLINPKPNQKLTLASYQEVPDTRKIHDAINGYFVQHRSKIVFDLCETENAQDAEVKEFKKALSELDTVIAVIQLLTYLSDKNNKADGITNLLDSNFIKTELLKFRDDKTLPSGWLACLDSEINKVIDYQTFQAIPDLANHCETYRLWEQGITQLQLFKDWKHLTKMHFPILSSFISPDVYIQQCMQARAQLFELRVIEQDQAKWKEKFEKAKDRLKRLEDLPIAADTQNAFYLKHSTNLYDWPFRYSRHPLFTEFTQHMVLNELDDIPVGELSKMYMLPFGWSASIRSLMQYAAKFGECQFHGLKTDAHHVLQFHHDTASDEQCANPANMSMFIEGAQAYIDYIINYSKIDPIAINDTAEKRINNIRNLVRVGEQIKFILVEIATAKPLFSKLLTRYNQLIFEPHTFIRQKLGDQAMQSDKRDDVFRLLATDAYRGARDKLFDHLSTYAIWLQQYLSMAFGYETKVISANSLQFLDTQYTLYTDKTAFLAYLKAASDQDQLGKAIDDYLAQIQKLSTAVQHRVDQANDLNAFYQYLMDQLKVSSPTLIIDAEVSPLPLTEDKLKLLTLFLKQSQSKITHIAFSNVIIDDNACLHLMNLLTQFQGIESLRLSNANLSPISLEIMSQFLPTLPTLTALDISGNKLSFKHSNAVCDLLENFKNLQALNISGCDIKDVELYRIMNIVEKSPQLSVVDFSNNPITTNEEWVDCLQMLVDKCPTLTKVAINNIPLSPESEQLLQKQINARCTIQAKTPLALFQTEALKVRSFNKMSALNHRLGQPALDETLTELYLHEQKLTAAKELSSLPNQSSSRFVFHNQPTPPQPSSEKKEDAAHETSLNTK